MSDNANPKTKTMGQFMLNSSLDDFYALLPDLTKYDIAVYLTIKTLTRYAPYTNVSNETIALKARTSVRTIERSISRLKSMGLIETSGVIKRQVVANGFPTEESEDSRASGQNSTDSSVVKTDNPVVNTDSSVGQSDNPVGQSDSSVGHKGVLKEYVKEDGVKEYHEGGVQRGAEHLPAPASTHTPEPEPKTETETPEDDARRKRIDEIQRKFLDKARPGTCSPEDDPILKMVRHHLTPGLTPDSRQATLCPEEHDGESQNHFEVARSRDRGPQELSGPVGPLACLLA